MISSIIWIVLVMQDKIDAQHAPWDIYLPIVFVELVVYLKLLPKIADFIDRVMGNKVEGE